MAALEFALKILDPEEMKPEDRPIEFGLSIIGTSKEQRDLAVQLLRRAATKIEDDTMKKFGTGEVIPEPDDQAKPLSDEDRAALLKETEAAQAEAAYGQPED